VWSVEGGRRRCVDVLGSVGGGRVDDGVCRTYGVLGLLGMASWVGTWKERSDITETGSGCWD
jgi:hypothetical protein